MEIYTGISWDLDLSSFFLAFPEGKSTTTGESVQVRNLGETDETWWNHWNENLWRKGSRGNLMKSEWDISPDGMGLSSRRTELLSHDARDARFLMCDRLGEDNNGLFLPVSVTYIYICVIYRYRCKEDVDIDEMISRSIAIHWHLYPCRHQFQTISGQVGDLMLASPPNGGSDSPHGQKLVMVSTSSSDGPYTYTILHPHKFTREAS